MIDHVKAFVSDLERSKGFYVQALEPLGYRVVMQPAPVVVGFGVDWPDFWLELRPESVTTAHLAFRAESPEVVDAFHRAALEAGGRDNGAPGLRPMYHPRYYGGFVLDPDGNNVEAVCHSAGG
jgi:catechol 2,3-dioxygenase-like lactoylglutathione lyase family enzyme